MIGEAIGVGMRQMQAAPIQQMHVEIVGAASVSERS